MKILNTKRLLAGLLAMTIQTAHAGGGGGGLAGGATELTQLANKAQLLLAYVEQTQQTVHQFNTYMAMLQSLKQLTPSNLVDNQAFKLWQDNGMTQTFHDLYQVVNNGQRIAYTLQSQDSMLRSLSPGYGQYANFDFQSGYKNWSDNTRNAVVSALQTGKAQAEDFNSEGDMIRELTNRSHSANGQVEALQAGNEIGIAMVGQLQKLRQLQLAQMNAQQMAKLSEQAELDGRPKKYDGGCDRILSGDEIRAIRRRGENAMDYCR